MEPIVHGILEFLSAPDVPLCRLHGRVTGQELDLFEFVSCAVAKTDAGAAEVMRRKTVNADRFGLALTADQTTSVVAPELALHLVSQLA